MKVYRVRLVAFFSRFLHALIPPARRRLTGREVLPLAVFLLVFMAVVLLAEWKGWLSFTWKPAFAFLLVTPWIWWLQVAGWSGLQGWRARLSLQMRLWIAGLLILVLAEPRAGRTSDTLSLVYALDLSDSIGETVETKSLDWIRASAKQKREKDEAGLVVFGREAAVELPPRPDFPLETIGSIVPRDATSLAKGLRMAGAMLPDRNPGRIVLISDGNETDGQVIAAADELKSRGIAIDVLPVNLALEKEVWLERLDLPRSVKLGESYEAAVQLSSLHAGQGTLRLMENGTKIFEREVTFTAGKNRLSVPIPGRPAGYYEYLAAISTAKDEDFWPQNNQAASDVYLKGEGRVLVITDSRSDFRDWETLVQTLKESKRVVQVRMSYETPRDATALLPYDLIVIPNAPADGFDAMQLQALHDAVYNFGAGLLMLGHEQTFGPGGYHKTPLAKVLPVDLEVSQKKVLPLGALMVALDRSGSMSAMVNGETKLTLANRGAAAAFQVLGDQDYFGVLAVDTIAHPVIPLGRQQDRASVLAKIRQIDVGGGGIYIYTALAKASLALQHSDAAAKHIILFADAADAEEQSAGTQPDGMTGTTSALELVSAMSAMKITTTVVALGQQQDKDTEFLRELAARGLGRFYLTSDPSELPQIFVKEAKTVKRQMLQKRTFVPEAAFPSPVLKGLTTLPPLHGYVLTQPKPTASVVLQAPLTPEAAANQEMPDPILAIWRYGLGTGAAWTSDLSSNWARDWIGWTQFSAFIKQFITEISRVDRMSDLSLRAASTGTQGLVLIEDQARADRFLELKARITGPHERSVDVALKQTAPRRYRAEFPLWGEGRYQVSVAGVNVSAGTSPRANAEAEQVFGGFTAPYSPEYLRFQSDPRLLANIADRTGGRVLSASDLNLFTGRETRRSSQPIFDWFLIALACLVPLDVALRRVQLDWSFLARWRRAGVDKNSGGTMGALIERKRQIQTAPTTPPPPVAVASKPIAPVSAKPASIPAAHPAAGPAAKDLSETTTGRLLARKKAKTQREPAEGGEGP